MKQEKIKCPGCDAESSIEVSDFVYAFRAESGYYNCSQCESVVFVKIDLDKKKIISAEISKGDEHATRN